MDENNDAASYVAPLIERATHRSNDLAHCPSHYLSAMRELCKRESLTRLLEKCNTPNGNTVMQDQLSGMMKAFDYLADAMDSLINQEREEL